MKVRNVLILLILSLILLGSLNFGLVSATSPEQTDTLWFELNRMEEDKWVNVTVNGLDYSVESNTLGVGGLSGSLISSPWYVLESKVEDASFFTLNSMETGNFELTVHINSQQNTILFDTILADPTPELGVLFANVGQVVDNIIGRNVDQSVWPVDLSQVVLESYPEQYGIDVLLQRMVDNFAVVLEGNATLLVGYLNQSSNYAWFATPIYVQTQNYSIPNNGGSTTVNFDTFTLGINYSPSELYFAVVVDHAVISIRENGLPSVVGVSDEILDSIGNATGTYLFLTDEVPFLPAWLALLPIAIIVISRRKISKFT